MNKEQNISGKRQSPRVLTTAAIIAAFSSASCLVEGTVGMSTVKDGPAANGANIGSSDSKIATELSASSVVAGMQVKASCFIREGGSFVPVTAPTIVVVSPIVAQINQSNGSAIFSTNTAGLYRVSCRLADNSEVDSKGASLTVTAGAAFSWVVDLLDRDCYSQKVGLPIDFMVYDNFGNEIADSVVEMHTTPSVPITIDDFGRFKISQEGIFDITLEVKSALAPGSTIQPFNATVMLDSAPPAITLATPTRGAMIQSGGFADSPVAIVGSASDATTRIVSLSINGTPVSISGDGHTASFSLNQNSRWGMNIINGRSEDECGNVGVLSLSFLRSPSYFPAAVSPNSQARVADGAMAQINQTAIDDSDRTDADDLTTIANNVFAAIDIDTMIAPSQMIVSDPLAICEGCFLSASTWNDIGYGVYRHNDPNRHITWQAPVVNYVKVVNGGIQVSAHIGAVNVPLLVYAADRECALGCSTTHGWYTLEADVGLGSLDLSANLTVNYSGGQAQVSLSNIAFNLQGAYVDLDCGIVDGLCDAVTGAAVNYVSGALKNAITSEMQIDLSPVMQTALSSMTVAACIAAPAPLDMELNVAAGLDTVAFCGPDAGMGRPASCPASTASGYGTLGLFAQFFPSAKGATIPGSARGAIRKDGAAPVISSSATNLGMGVKDDLINQLLWALWYGGAFDADLTSLLGSSAPSGTILKMATSLPPVIMPGHGSNELDVGIGDVRVDATVDLGALLNNGMGSKKIHVAAYISLILGGSIDIDGSNNTLVINVDPAAEAGVQIDEIDDMATPYQGELSEFLARVLREKLPGVLQSAIGSFPLPAMGIGGLPGIAAGTYLGIGNAGISRANDYMVFTGTLVNKVGTVPPLSQFSWPWPTACKH